MTPIGLAGSQPATAGLVQSRYFPRDTSVELHRWLHVNITKTGRSRLSISSTVLLDPIGSHWPPHPPRPNRHNPRAPPPACHFPRFPPHKSRRPTVEKKAALFDHRHAAFTGGLVQEPAAILHTRAPPSRNRPTSSHRIKAARRSNFAAAARAKSRMLTPRQERVWVTNLV
jgi:hypothetical protein